MILIRRAFVFQRALAAVESAQQLTFSNVNVISQPSASYSSMGRRDGCRPLFSASSPFACACLSRSREPSKAGNPVEHQKRFLWGWLNSIFNRVDESRIKEVGPDRACAEWLLRCGAGVRWDKGPDEWLRDYNSLPAGNYRGLRIVEIDATDSAVMHIGFTHFRGLKHVRKAIFHKCGYMEDEAVRRIGYLKDSLEELQISSCGNVSDEGILTLVELKNLKKLKLYDFLEVRDRQKCLSVLKENLPNCLIEFPFARESDRDPPAERSSN
ncbi:ATP synthase subunit s, mitochondrial [Orchesella cincta]|uniref:ATP synthase subunit s, mitochondrial n=1 Tax=Orchesella cincta TaxID=48709 RepID=A0A1D2NKD6_ORCCI|nr:ATP synthase subunit s, mitochondrial [Orchesella cincta]